MFAENRARPAIGACPRSPMLYESNDGHRRHGRSEMLRDWRCTKCRARLGRWVGGRLELKYKEVIYKVGGEQLVAEVKCRICGKPNESPPATSH